MAITLGDAIVYLRGNSEALDRALGQAEKQTRGTVGRLGGVLKKGIGVAAAGAATAVVGIGAAAVGMGVKAFSEFETTRATLNELRASFTDTADDWIRWSKRMQRETTFSDESFQSAASGMRTLVESYGMGEDQVRGLITASADLAALKKIDLAEASERVQAAMRGEAESAEFLGLTLNDTYMKNMAFDGSLSETWETLSDAEKAQYRYQEALNQMAYAQGEAGKQAATFSGSVARIKNVAQDAWATVGGALAPVLDTLGTNLANDVIPIIETGADVFQRFTSGLQEGKEPIDAFRDSIEGVFPPETVARLVAFAEQVKQWGEQFRAGFRPFQEQIAPRLREFRDEIQPKLVELGEKLKEVWGKLTDALAPLAEKLGISTEEGGGFAEFLGQLAGLAVWNTLDFYLTALIGLIDLFIAGLEGIGNIIDATVQGVEKLTGVFDSLTQNIELPEWLQPGSATPFEEGLRGIADAINQMPSLSEKLSASGLGGAGSGQSVTDNRQSVTMYGPQFTGVQDAGGLLEQLAALAA